MFKKRLHIFSLFGLICLVTIISLSASSQASNCRTVSNDTNLTIITEDFIYDWTASETTFTLNLSDSFVSGFYFLNLLWCSSGDKSDDPGYSFTIISEDISINQGTLQRNLQDDQNHLTPLAFEIINPTSELKIVFSWSSLFHFKTGQLTIFKESSIEIANVSPSSPSAFSPSLSTLSFTSTYAHGELAAIVCSEAETLKEVTIHSEVDLSAASSFKWLKVEILQNGFILLDREIDNGGSADLTFILIAPSNFTYIEIKLTAMGSGLVKFKIINIDILSPSEDGSNFEDSLPGVPIEDFRLSVFGKTLIFDPIEQLFFFFSGFFLNIFIVRNIFFYKIINSPPGVEINLLEHFVWYFSWAFIMFILLDFIPIDPIRNLIGTFFVIFLLYIQSKADNHDVKIENFNHIKKKESLRFFDSSNGEKIPKSVLNLPLNHKSTTLTTENDSEALVQLIVGFALSKEKNIDLMNWKKEQAQEIYDAISSFAHIRFTSTNDQSQVLIIFDPISCEKEAEKIDKLEKQLKEEGAGIAILLTPYISALIPFSLIETKQKATPIFKSHKNAIQNDVDFYDILGTRKIDGAGGKEE